MIIRLTLFEGRVRDGRDRDFRNYVSEELMPLWRRFPGVREVRVLHELDRDDDASSVPPILSMAFADRQALDVAPDLDVRRTSGEVARGLLEMFDGRVRHHVFDAAPADPLDRR